MRELESVHEFESARVCRKIRVEVEDRDGLGAARISLVAST